MKNSLSELTHGPRACHHRLENIKSILVETVLAGQAILFWAVALPAAVVFFPAVALWEKIEAATPQGPIDHVGLQLTLASS